MELTLSAIDEFLSQHRHFCLLDWLLDHNAIAFADYEAWRRGEWPVLEERITLPREQLMSLVERAETLCHKLNLLREAQTHYAWQGEPAPLTLSRDRRLQAELGAYWQRSQDLPQMDLFMDNAALIAENRVLQAIAQRQYDRAAEYLHQLSHLNPSHARLGGFQDLLTYGQHMQTQPDIAEQDLIPELQGLHDEVCPLAREVLGLMARDYLAQAWRRLARNLQGRTFEAAQPDCHISFALLQIPDWQGLEASLVDEPQLYRAPELMARLAQAYYHNRQSGLALLTWALLVDAYPDRGEALLSAADVDCKALWDDFLAYDEHWSSACFLGYAVIRKPGLLQQWQRLPAAAVPLPQTAVNRTTCDLVAARLAEQPDNHLRQTLQTQSPAMLRCFLNKRDWYRR